VRQVTNRHPVDKDSIKFIKNLRILELEGA
jgi:hypothetical protein